MQPVRKRSIEDIVATATEEPLTVSMTDIEKVVTALQAFPSRETKLVTRYVNPAKFIQHNPSVADGLAGLQQELSQPPKANDHLEVVRAFQNGPYVFAHSEGLIAAQGVFFDVFRFETGVMVEHWVFSAGGAPPNRSGHTQTDGPTRINPSEETEKNKSIVREYYETVHVGGDHDKIPRYFSGDRCIRHEPGVSDGVAAFKRDLEELVKHRSIDEIKLVLGQADFVFIAAKGSHESNPCVYVDLYRVEDGKIAERWGFSQETPPRSECRNANGML